MIEVRYKEPTRLDKEAYGSIWKVIGENDHVTYWVQLSKNETEWVDITFYFNENFQELMQSGIFKDHL